MARRINEISKETVEENMEAITFLNLIFADGLTKDRRLVILTLPNKAREFFTDAEAAIKYAQGKTDKQNVYFGLGLIRGNPKGRGKLTDIAAIGCLWADIDIAGEGHKKTNLPVNLTAARNLLDRIGLKPSIIVHSGHGLQAYWLLKEPWIFDTPTERHQAATLARRWVATVRAVAGVEGYDVDAVGDLTRVFRLPDTINRKGEPVPVKIIENDPALRYGIDDFDPLLVAEEFEPDTEGAVRIGALTLRADAEPPALKLLAMMDNDLKFKKTWRRTRTDLQDQSPSAYDLSLASIAAAAGWPDQEIANLIIATRRQHNDDLTKALRRDYIQRTIAKARASQQEIQTVAELADTAEKIIKENAASPKERREQRQGLLERLSATLGISITRWVQHGQENARYSLLLGDGRWVRMGQAGDVLNPAAFRTRLYEATGTLVKTYKKKGWDNICKCLAAAVEITENVEATSAYQAEQWVNSYLEDHPTAPDDDWQEAASINEPFRRDDAIHVHAGELRKHMRLLQHENRITHVELCDCLKVSGYTRLTVTLRSGDKVMSRSYWAKKCNTVKGAENLISKTKN